ncbi:MAG TPA: glycoside hydrolase family 28 protein [Acidobacteriaceae bacterium]|nr:glycoside hydrolase family 28 protein [Acidobacteriaceae bacterium]
MTLKSLGTQAGWLVSRRSLFMLPALAAAPQLGAQSRSNFLPTGLTGDGVTLDTHAIQAAIDRCTAAGGGSVVLPAGRYLTGTLRLRDHVTLVLEAGAVLLGSTRLEDYPILHDAISSFTSTYTDRCLIRADGASDIAITGAGTIDGNGTAFAGKYKVRPFLMRFVGCHGVHVTGITLQNPAMWTQHYLECQDVLIEGIRVRSRRARVNNDGIDVDSCQRVRIANCDIDAGDDAIVLKATTNSPCRDVVVTNCILSTLCNAFKLGTESNGGFDNIVFSNSSIYDTQLAGIALETVDGGNLGRVNISNIVIRNTRYPIFLCLGNRARPVTENAPRPGIAAFSGVMIRGVIAEASSPFGCLIAGLPDHPIEDVVLDDIQLTTTGGGVPFQADQQVPERPDAYPEAHMFGPLPASGLYCRHVRGLSLSRIVLRTSRPDLRPVLVADDAENLTVSNLSGPATGNPLIELHNVRHARIRETRTSGSEQALLSMSGSETQDISVAPDQEETPRILSSPDVSAKAWRLKEH